MSLGQPFNKESFVLDESCYEETLDFLGKHVALKQIIEGTRPRFEDISEILLDVGINRHDQPHQKRVALYSAAAMRQLKFKHYEILAGGVAGFIHDYGYLEKNPNTCDPDPTSYNGGPKGYFKLHALHGAKEIENKLNTLFKIAKRSKNLDFKNIYQEKSWRSLLIYKDELGEYKLINHEDIKLIVEIILNHNDYRKNESDYDPKDLSRPTLMVQIFDKLDNCRERVYAPEHLNPSIFIEGNEDYDVKYFHRCVPYCIQDYQCTIEPKNGNMRVVYQVELEEFNKIMKKDYPDFNYTEEMFEKDFLKAYTKNSQIAAEAIGVVLNNITDDPTLTVELNFTESNNKTEIPFARPDRPIYQKTGIVCEKIADVA